MWRKYIVKVKRGIHGGMQDGISGKIARPIKKIHHGGGERVQGRDKDGGHEREGNIKPHKKCNEKERRKNVK